MQSSKMFSSKNNQISTETLVQSLLTNKNKTKIVIMGKRKQKGQKQTQKEINKNKNWKPFTKSRKLIKTRKTSCLAFPIMTLRKIEC